MKIAKLVVITMLTVLGAFTLSDSAGCAQTAAPAAAKAESKAESKQAAFVPRNLAIFIFDGVQIIDYTGPYEVFGQAHDGEHQLFNVYTVSQKAEPITTAMGMTVIPKYSFENMPKADVLVLPGGGVRPHMDDPKVIKWVQDSAARAEYVMSVCNGAFYLGRAGLLDGLTATTFYGLIDELKTVAPKAKVVTDQRFVDNGKVITTAGLSSGIDGALHLVERIVGRGRAQEIALNLEYNWQPDVNYARASFADLHLRRVLGREGFTLPEGTGWKILGQQGGRDNWEKNWEVRLNTSAPDLLKIIDGKLAEKWSRAEARNANDGGAQTLWKFSDEAGAKWNAVSTVRPVAGEKETFKLTIRLAREGASASLLD